MPERAPGQVLGNAPIVVVAPHPDDESLGCAGLIAEAVGLGLPVHLVIVTDGAASHGAGVAPERLRSIRRDETLAAAATLGIPPERVTFWNVPDGRAPRTGRAAAALGRRLAELIETTGARTIVTSWDYDSHPDHVSACIYGRIAGRLTRAAVLAYPVWTWMMPPDAMMPNLPLAGFRLTIGPRITLKREAVMRHRSQTIPGLLDAPGFTLTEAQLDAFITASETFVALNAEARQRCTSPVKPAAAGVSAAGSLQPNLQAVRFEAGTIANPDRNRLRGQ